MPRDPQWLFDVVLNAMTHLFAFYLRCLSLLPSACVNSFPLCHK